MTGPEELKPETIKTSEAPVEIERKFVVQDLPENLDQYPHAEISQGYISIQEDGTEERLRKKGDKYYRTVKSGSGEVRSEIETEISQEEFEALWPQTEGRRVEKVRYQIPEGGGVIELDVYGGLLAGLHTAEREFDSEEESRNYIPPQWIGRDVTKDKSFKNQSLALYGLPQEVIKVPEYGFEEGVQELIHRVKERAEKGTVIVEIAGGSASGKTSAVAKRLMESLGEDGVLISMDDYYRGRTFMDSEAAEGRVLNWDQPEALNLELVREHLEGLKQGRAISKPIYSFKTGEPESPEEVQPKKVVVIEGLFALDDSLKSEADVRAFVDIGTHGRILRRLLRDIERTGQKPADILRYFAEIVEPMHEKYVQNTKKNADLVIKNEYSPQIEAERSGLHEVQLKFRRDLDPETLRKIGAEKLGATIQVDHYYNPRDRNLVETDELLRIREESNHRILTYKGPRIESPYRERPKFEFEIDGDTEGKFLAIYGDRVKTIKKERTLYQLDGVVFSVDVVSKVEEGNEEPMGTFVEIRSTDRALDNERIDSALAKLQLQRGEGIRESYFELAT